MKPAYKLISITFVLVVAAFANGQTAYFQVKSAKKEDRFAFPLFSSAVDSLAAKNINQFLQLTELELLDGYQQNNIFEKVSIDDGTIYGGKVEMSYRLNSNNSKVLSVKFDETSCGATCAYWVRYYNFNSGNGDLIQLKDLFTSNGFIAFNKKILRKRTAKYKKELMKIDSAERKHYLDVIGCFEHDNLHDYYIKDTSLIIDGYNCLSKHQKFDGLNMLTKFHVAEFKNYLNDYGKAVFGITEDSVVNYRSYELPQLYEGTIDSSLKILLVLNNGYQNEMRGVYAYLKYGRGIYLEGDLANQELTMTENTERYDDNGYIDATFDGKQLSGTWSDKNRTKNLKLVATRRLLPL